jgi:hypothetical protein
MTTPIVDLKCPTCGHLIGEEEYERVRANFDRLVELKSNGEIEQIRYECDRKDQQLEDLKKQYGDMKKQFEGVREEYERNVENLANQKAGSRISEMGRKHEEELAVKDRQNRVNVEDTLRARDRQLAEEKAGYTLHIQRVEKENRELSVTITGLTAQVAEQKKTLENKSSEHRGTTGELVLLDDLHSAFPDDELVPKIVGVEMADVIQTVVENKEKIAPPIVWDRKTSDKVTPSHISKAKQYKITHNTDYSIIVTENGITEKDSNNRMLGERDGIKLVHPTAVVDMARIFRSVIVDKAKQTSSNKNRTSKEAKLYEYLKSSEYARAFERERNATLSLDNLQRKEEKYHKTTWDDRKNLVDELRKIGEQKQQKINDIMRSETGEDSKDDSNKKEEE